MQGTITLDEFILQSQPSGATGTFSTLLSRIATASKVVSSLVRGSTLAGDIGFTGSKNTFGEQVQKLDMMANDVFVKMIIDSGTCSSVASEELKEPVPGRIHAPYSLAIDPLDGSSNIDVNISIGTIFAIYKCAVNDVMSGKDQVAAGYVIYGSATILVLALPQGVNVFTLDPSIGEYILTMKDVKVPQSGSIYSVNEGNYHRWTNAGVREWVDACKQRGDTARYVGSMVADCHRTLLKGGVFVYPEDSKNVYGKLRVMYEANPMAYVFEKAGGKAVKTSGGKLLDCLAQHHHCRTSVVIGSVDNVNELLTFTSKEDAEDNAAE